MTQKKNAKNITNPKKTGRTSTRRSTGGPGFAFEDEVAAWFVLKILTGRPLPGIAGVGTQLQMQTETLGWFIDDVLLTALVAPADERRIAISCKSSVQVSSSGLPWDFVERAWKQWSSGTGPMRPGKDCLMLATRGHHPGFEATWTDLKTWAPGADPVLAVSQMRATAKHGKIFDSVKTPAQSAKVSVTDADVVSLIRSIEVMPFDFDMPVSRDEQAAIGDCRLLLASGSLTEAKDLWDRLVTEARETRLGTGTLHIADFRRDLRRRFALKDYPDFEASWTRLCALSGDYIADIETKLPTGLSLSRQIEVDEVAALIECGPASVVFGDSGVGKSALVKTVLRTRFTKTTQVWFEPELLETALSEASRATIGLSQPLIDVLDASAHAENILVIDAAERLGSGARRAQTLISDLLNRNKAAGSNAWRVVIIGQTVAWENGELQKLAGVISPPYLEIKAIPAGEVKGVLQATKGLAWLAAHDDAVSALRNLQTLDWVIQAASRFQDAGAGERMSLITIADRLWSFWTGDKAAHTTAVDQVCGARRVVRAHLCDKPVGRTGCGSVRCPAQPMPFAHRSK